jgi:hypothetical protein
MELMGGPKEEREIVVILVRPMGHTHARAKTGGASLLFLRMKNGAICAGPWESLNGQRIPNSIHFLAGDGMRVNWMDTSVSECACEVPSSASRMNMFTQTWLASLERNINNLNRKGFLNKSDWKKYYF